MKTDQISLSPTLFEPPHSPLHLFGCLLHLLTFKEPSEDGGTGPPSPGPPPTSSTERELKNFCLPR